MNIAVSGILRKARVATLYAVGGRKALKEYYELKVWTNRANREGQLVNYYFKEWFTTYFGLSETFFTGKRLLDVGCGPRGSLEWAHSATERIGLDPMATKYRRLGTAMHQMRYVNGCAEALPFQDNYFDVVSSFDSLKHVDDLDLAIREISRVMAPGGIFLLHTIVGARRTRREPTPIPWDVAQRFAPRLEVIEESRYERFFGYRDRPEEFVPRMHSRLPFDNSNPTQRLGVLAIKFAKVSES